MVHLSVPKLTLPSLAGVSLLLATSPVFARSGGGGSAGAVATISDSAPQGGYPVQQVIEPPNQGPPEANFANVYWAETVVTSWFSEIRFWEGNYVPTGGSDTGGSESPYQFASGNTDNAAGQTKNVGVASNEMFTQQAGQTFYFCFHTHGFSTNGNADAYTGIQIVDWNPNG